MIKKIKDMLFPILIGAIAILLMVWWVSLGQAHESKYWKDAQGSGVIVEQEPCGLGYAIFTRPDGSVQPIVMAGGFHVMRDTHGIKNCDQLFIFLMTGESFEVIGPGPVMTYNHPADKEGQ